MSLRPKKSPLFWLIPLRLTPLPVRRRLIKRTQKILADLHRTNLLPQAFVPSKPQREWRQPVRFRLQLVQTQTILKTRLRDLLQKQRLTCPYQDILGQKSLVWLDEQSMPVVYQTQLHSLLNQAHLLKQEITAYDRAIHAWAKQDPCAKLLQSIPGIGPIITGVIMAEVGDISRFPTARCFAAYCGVTPSVKASGGKTYLGKTNKHASSYLRWCLAEAVVHIHKRDPVMKQAYERLTTTKGKGKAKVALMNKLARIIFAVLKRKSPYYQEALPPSD